MSKSKNPATQAIHGTGERSKDPIGVNTPVHVSTAGRYINEGMPVYPRMGNTPNHLAVIDQLCALEGGEDAFLYSSGMGAISAMFLSLLSPGDHLVLQANIYGGTLLFVDAELTRFGVEVTYVKELSVSAFEKAIQPNTRLIHIESPSNPLLSIVDIKGMAAMAKRHGVLTSIDNTFATPIVQKPLGLGIDIVAHSGSKYIGGHSDVMLGVIVASKDLIDRVRWTSVNLGATINTQALYLVERSIKTLDVRVKRQNENAQYVAEALEKLPQIEKVFYPGLSEFEGHELAKAQMNGFGAVVSFRLATSVDTVQFLKNLQLIAPALSLGGIESTICIPRITSHLKLTDEEASSIGITMQVVRLSVGVEHPDDIVQDITQAL